jgi:hypothetical protein
MSISIEFEGLDAVIKGIEAYKNEVIEGVKNTLEESAINIEGHSKQRVRVRTGNLKRAITHKGSDDGLTQEIGTYDVDYASSIEYGTYRTPSFPYLRPSLEEEMPNLVKNIEKILEGK